MSKLPMLSGAALALLCGIAVGGCTPTSPRGTEATVGAANTSGQTAWRPSCGSYDNFGARLSVDQCGGAGPFIR
jgi:hypothetical protein